MQLKDLVNWIEEKLSSRMEETEVSAHRRILMEYFLEMSRAEVQLNATKLVSEEARNKVQLAVKELLDGKPIDYVINESIFLGFPFYVDENVLIPRPETEELVMWMVELEKSKADSILDIGTGSGCIPIGLAMEGNYSKISACEVSAGALEVAKQNAKSFDLEIQFFLMDILTEVPNEKYEIVVSNPPYVKEEEIASLQQHVKEHEPIIALTPKGDPLIFYKRMLEIAPQMLKAGGRLYWEIHEDLGKEVIALFDQQAFTEVELKQDMFGRDRFVRAVYTP